MDDIIRHYEHCLEHYRGSCKEVDWPTQEGANKRYQAMCGICGDFTRIYNHSVLDFGCGTGGLIDYLGFHKRYQGCDASFKMVEEAQKRHIDLDFFHLSLGQQLQQGNWDYIVANGVFTEKRDYSWEDMNRYFIKTIKMLIKSAKKGVAFNLMDPHSLSPKAQREELFFVNYSHVATVLRDMGITNYIFNCSYLPFEYTVYCYKGEN